jgi:hypothetical protein
MALSAPFSIGPEQGEVHRNVGLLIAERQTDAIEPNRSFRLEQTSCEQFEIASDQSPMVSVIGRGGYCHESRQKSLARQGKERVFG